MIIFNHNKTDGSRTCNRLAPGRDIVWPTFVSLFGCRSFSIIQLTPVPVCLPSSCLELYASTDIIPPLTTMARHRLRLVVMVLAVLTTLPQCTFAQDFSNQEADTGKSDVLMDQDTVPGTFPMPEEKMDEFSKILTTEFSPESFPDAPLQLVRPDHQHKKLVIVEENLKYLYALNQPVATVSVVGKFHSGKSFLMNQLMGKSNGFGIGPTISPTTMGIWLWGSPLKIENPTGPSQWILLLDTEGFAASNVSENYDAKIFAVSTLLSSKLLYNSVKVIDQSDIDYLELLARRTQLFALKAQMTPQKGWMNDFSIDFLDFPSLMWVIQDFVQDTGGEECRQWLVRLLSSHARESDYEISLKDIFPSVDCHTLFIPSARKIFLTDLSRATEVDLTEEYREERDELIAKIKRTVKPKRKNDKPFTGIDLALLLRILVNAANAGSLTDIPNRWDAFLEKLQKSAVEDCFKFYQAHMNNLLVDQAKNEPVNCASLDSWHAKSLDNSIRLLTHLLQGLPKPLEASKPELDHLIVKYFTSVNEMNKQKIHVKLFNLQKSYELKAVDAFLLLKLPVLSSELASLASSLEETFSSQFIGEVGDLVEPTNLTSYLNSLAKSVKLNHDSTALQNQQKLGTHFENITTTLLDGAFSEVTINFVTPLSKEAFESLIQQSLDRTIEAYHRRAGDFTAEVSIFEAKRDKLKLGLLEKSAILRTDNDNSVNSFLKKEMQTFLYDFERITAAYKKSFPMDFAELKKMLTAEVDKFKGSFDDDLKQYRGYQVYATVQETLATELIKLAEMRVSENLDAFKAEVEKPLNLAKQMVLLAGSKYGTLFSFKRFVLSSCMLHLNDGKAKDWPERLKVQIIESFMRDDAQLKAELESRQGIWSSIVGFFQWFMALIFG